MAVSGSGVSDDEVVLEIEHCIRVFSNGRVERYFGSDPVPPSTDASTGVASKDCTISPDVAVRLYLPSVAAESDGEKLKLPLLVYFHGGGFLLHTAFNSVFHSYLGSLAARARAIVVSVEYRLAPEHPLPAAYEDSWEALVWVASRAGGGGEESWLADHADFSRLSLGGDSAGANIAHHMAMRAGAEGLPGGATISGIVLVHPYFLGHGRVPSEDSDPAMADTVVKMWRAVSPSSTGVDDDPWINPLAAGAPAMDGLGCGRVLMCLAETDVVRDRGRAYCDGLKASGWAGEVEVLEVAGQGHCFHLVNSDCAAAVRQDDAIARFLNLSNLTNDPTASRDCRPTCLIRNRPIDGAAQTTHQLTTDLHQTPSLTQVFVPDPDPRAAVAMDAGDAEMEFDMPNFMRIYKSGRIERLNGTETVPPCPSGDPANGVASKDVVLDAAANVSARLYLPAEAAAEDGKKLPVVVFFHGGAFLIQNSASPIYHRYAASLAAAVPAVVVSVEYRLAPENPVPAAYDDAFAAVKAVVSACRPGGAVEPWLAAHGDASRVVLAGDSAGGNMAHNTAIRLRKEDGDKVSAVVLQHCYFWGKEPVGGEPTDAAYRGHLERVWEVAGGGNFGHDHPYINPFPSPEEWSHLGCGRVLVTTAEHCWFVDRARAYAAEVNKCGWDGEVEFYETKDEDHVYFLFNPDRHSAAMELAVVSDFIRRC